MNTDLNTTSTAVTNYKNTQVTNAEMPGDVSVSFIDYTQKIAALSDDEKQKYLSMASALNPHDIASVQSFGTELSSIISRNGDNLLGAVRGNNTTEVVQLTNDILGQLNMIDMDELNGNKGFKGFIRRIPILNKLVTSYSNILIKYDTVKENIDKISDKIGTSKIVALRDNTTLQTIFDSNLAYMMQLRELIIAAKLKYQEAEKQYTMMATAPDMYEAYQISDMQAFKDILGKKIADMETTEYIFNQNLLQIRATQQNNYAVADKADNIVNNIIPIWKNQIAVGIIMNNQKNSVDAQKKITDTTNKILLANAKALKTNSIMVATANEEAIVKQETLENVTQYLIETIKEVAAIHEKGAHTRMNLEQNLLNYGKAIQDAMTSQTFGKLK